MVGQGVTLENWPEDVVCPGHWRPEKEEDAHWSTRLDVTGRVDSNVGSQASISFSPPATGCLSEIRVFLEQDSSSRRLRMLYHINGLSDVDNGIAPLVFEKL